MEDDPDVDYIEEDHAVRYIAGWRHTNQAELEEGEPPEREPYYETVPFERWAKTQCVSAAARAAVKHLNDELGTQGVSGGITSGVEGEDAGAFVSVSSLYDPSGEPIRVTSVEFDALVAATPETVGVTYILADEGYQVDVPVYAQHVVEHQLGAG